MKLNVLTARNLKISAVIVLSSVLANHANAQGDVAIMLKAGTADASKLVDAYMSPLLKGFGSGLNGGWYNTAKPHGLGRFDITLNVNAAFIPDADKVYDATKLGFSEVTIQNGTGPIGQTFAGEKNPANNPVYELNTINPVTGLPENLATFDAPTGQNIPFSGAPTAQIAVGLIKNTEVMIRYMPTVKLSSFGAKDVDGKIGLVGFGVKHDIKQWVPGMSKLPFDLSAFFGYTKFNFNLDLDLAPESGVQNQTGNNAVYTNQEIAMSTSATTIGAIVSKKLSVLTVYGSVAYSGNKTVVDMKGDYPLTIIETNAANAPQYGQKVVTSVKDPISFDVAGANGMNATLGARVKLLVLTLQGSYTFAKYPVATVGVGLNIDWK